MHARRTPERVRGRDPLDELLQRAVDPRPAEASTTRFPGPESLEASSMPTDDRLGLNEDQAFPPPSPEAIQPYPEEPVGEADLGPLDLLAQRGQLLPQHEVFQREVGPRSVGGPEGGEKGSKQTKHGAGVSTGFGIRST